jgi:hypothetical protein
VPERCRAARALSLAVVAAMAVACAGIPESGSVHVGRTIPAGAGLGNDVDVRVLPPPPQPGMSPHDVVQGFLRAMINREGGYQIARQYLTPRAADAWDADVRVTTYDDGGVRLRQATSGTGSVVGFQAPRLGFIDQRGDFAPRGGLVRAEFGLGKVGGQWRIDRLPDGALLSTSDVTRSYRFANVYYANRTGLALVPEQVLLPPDPRGTTTALVRALVTGPGPWLAPAVDSGFPAGTELLGNVPVDRAGVAEVNLSAAARRASDEDLRTISSQLVWTLRQVQNVTTVRLLADGSQLAVLALDAAHDEWSALDPAPPPRVADAFFRDGASWRAVGGEQVPGLAPLDGLVDVALSRGADRVAALRPTQRGVALVVGPAGDEPTLRLQARELTAPSFGGAGDLYTVVTTRQGRWVARIDAADHLERVPAGSALTRRPVQELVISRDGARVAAIVGSPGHGRLLVGRVAVRDGRPRLDGFRTVLRGVGDVRGLSWGWTTPAQVVVSAAVAGGERELLAVDANGYSSVTISTAGLVGPPTDVATAPGRPLVVSASGEIWVDQATGWRRQGPGTQPRYAG